MSLSSSDQQAGVLVPVREVEVVEGRVIAVVTPADVVSAQLSRPTVRLAVYAAGVVHAMRPESRDRITALMRREYRSRHKARVRAARKAFWRTPVRSVESRAADA